MFNRKFVPDFPDQEMQRRANILTVTQLAAAVMTISVMIISVIFTPEHIEVWLQGFVGAFAMLVSYILLRKGKLESSAWIVVVLGWLILTLDLALLSGIRGVNVLGQVLIVIFAGLVLDGRSALLITAGTLGANYLIFQMELVGILASPNPLPTSVARWFIQSIYLSLAAVYIWRADSVIKKTLKETRAIAERFQALFEHTTDCVVVFDSNWQVLMANPRILDLLGYSMEEVAGRRMLPERLSRTPQVMEKYQLKVSRGIETPAFEQVLVRKDGSPVPVEVSITIVPDSNGNPRHIQCVLRDITDRKNYEKQLKHQALHDPLTDLPNRKHFEDKLHQALLIPENGEDQVAVMFLDLDDFKEVNDSFGHQVGDQVLIEIASRLKATLRESDTVARIGGDEFLIILENIPNKENVERVAEKINQIISRPYLVGEQPIRLSVSIGVNITQRSHLDQLDLVLASDVAMYQVKRSGKNSYQFYELEGENPWSPGSDHDPGTSVQDS